MFKSAKADVAAAQKFDPAAAGRWMIYFFYPGVIALRRHRRAHKLWQRGFKSWARYMAYRTRKKTNIDIHPAAKIGQGVFIDHGAGVVIGETSVIGDNCVIYHGVTLGSNSFEKVDRHPKIGNNVIIYTNSTVIGPITIGDNSIIGAHTLVLKSAPPNSRLKGTPAHHNQ